MHKSHNKFRIAIDTSIIHVNNTGIGNYVKKLCQHLPAGDSAMEFDFISTPWITKGKMNGVSLKLENFYRDVVWTHYALPRKIKTDDYDLLHSPSFSSPLSSKCPMVTTFHDMTPIIFPDFFKPWHRRHAKYMLKRVARENEMIIAVSQNTKNDLIRLFNIEAHKIKVIYPGVNSTFLRPVSSSKLQNVLKQYNLHEKKYILYVGTLEPRKNIVTLLHTFSNLLLRNKIDLTLVLVGGKGWYFEEIFTKIQHLNLVNRVFVADYVPARHLPYIYHGAQLFVFPSLYEGFGFPPLEAMACGTPVCVSNVSSLPEVVGEAGILIDDWNSDRTMHEILKLITDNEYNRYYSEQGMARAAKFSWDHCISETLNLYKTILS